VKHRSARLHQGPRVYRSKVTVVERRVQVPRPAVSCSFLVSPEVERQSGFPCWKLTGESILSKKTKSSSKCCSHCAAKKSLGEKRGLLFWCGEVYRGAFHIAAAYRAAEWIKSLFESLG